MAVYRVDDGRFVVANRVCRTLLGLDADAVGEHRMWSSAQHDDLMGALRDSGKIDEVELDVETPRRGTRRMLAALEVIEVDARPCVLVSFFDVTDRRRVRRQLAESDERFRQLADSLDQVVVLWTTDPQEILYISPSSMRLLGVSPEARLPREVVATTHPDDLPLLRDRVAATLSSEEPVDYEYRVAHPDGRVRWVRSRTAHVPSTDGRLRRSTVITDITDQRRAELQLETARADAEAANRAKSEFLSRMSHELRTPLNAVLGFGALLQSERLDGHQREYVDLIVTAGRHLLGLIDEVLDISRIETGQTRLSLEPVSPAAVVDEVLAMVAPVASSAGVPLVTQLIDPAIHVFADHLRLRQVLLNLLSNAIKYNQPGGAVRLVVEASGADRFRLSIADDGVGMSPEALSRLFVPFERLGAEATGVPGTGLGLALARDLTELMGGTIGVDSTVGVGSRFWIELALTDAPAAAASTASSPAAIEPPHAADGRDRVVLLVEDNASNIRLVEEILRRRPNLALVTARTGADALGILAERHVDLTLLDLGLPDMTGDRVLAAMRADPATASIPVVVVSADATAAHRDALRELGAADYITKPIDVERFLAVIDAAFRDSPTRILYIEDDEANRRLMSSFLRRLLPDVELSLAVDGRQGIAIAHEAPPDVVLIDFHLPDMTGLEILAELRADPHTTRTPAILLSGDSQPVDAHLDDHAHWMRKPYVMDDLVTLITEMRRG